MALESGTRLGPYEIGAPIGKGGMGEVYRARDTKLDRAVAIKVLPDELAADEERVARFEREAKLLASLNHPNIASIYGFETQDKTNALVLELVEGPTLAERIAQGPIPVDEAIAIAKQIAEALEAGHEAGVIHRDLKPANVKVREDGTVKVLDYGLAKALEGEASSSADSELSHSPTLTRHGTQLGMILGTAAYMSPEQAKGKKVDKRTDVWAFGAVVYEMLTGKRAFGGEDVSETLAAVIRAEPDLNALSGHTPLSIRRLLRRTLRKAPQERLADIRDARLELDEQDEPEGANEEGAPDSSRRSFGLALVGLLVGAFATFIVSSRDGASTAPVSRYIIEPVSRLSNAGPPAWSPDGSELVYPAAVDGGTQLVRWVRAANEHTPVRGTEGAEYPFFSPDGAWIGFFANNETLKKVPATGGPTQDLCPAGNRYGASWSPDGTIVFASRSARGLMRVSAEGGEPETLTEPSEGERHTWPHHLPSGDAVLFTVTRGGPVSDKEVAVLSLSTGATETLIAGTYPRFAASGHLIFGRENSLWSAPFDVEQLRVTTTPIPVAEGVQVNFGGGLAFFDLSGDGSLAYWTGEGNASFLARVDRQGEIEFLHEPREFRSPRFSPDGSRIAVWLDGDVWALDFERDAMSRLTVTAGRVNRQLVWDPDGERITYQEADGSLYSVRASGSADPERVGEVDAEAILSTWSPDGRSLLLYGVAPSQIYNRREGGSMEPLRASPTPFSERSPAISPDGRWLLYASDETGRFEIYVQSYPELDEKARVSRNGGVQPSWNAKGREILFVSPRRELMGAGFDGPSRLPIVEQPRVILDADTALNNLNNFEYGREYDPAPDGESIVATITPVSEGTGELHVVLNWLEELKRLVPVN